MKKWGPHVLGIGVCLATAGVSSFLFRSNTWKGLVPLLFLGVVVFVSERFGSPAGILGTVGAAILFAEFLFQPVFTLRVSDAGQRDNLIWMVIVGIALSEILGVQPKSPPQGGNPGNAS